MAASRAKTSPQSSPAGDFDAQFSDDDLCGYGCHSEGVPAGDIHTVSCEHGRYEVTAATKRKAAPPSQLPETVHDRSVHFPGEEPPLAPDTESMKLLLERSNGHEERLLKLEAESTTLKETVAALVEHIAGGAAAGETDPAE